MFEPVTIDWMWFNIMVFTYLNYWCIDQIIDGYYRHIIELKELEGDKNE